MIGWMREDKIPWELYKMKTFNSLIRLKITNFTIQKVTKSTLKSRPEDHLFPRLNSNEIAMTPLSVVYFFFPLITLKICVNMVFRTCVAKTETPLFISKQKQLFEVRDRKGSYMETAALGVFPHLFWACRFLLMWIRPPPLMIIKKIK